MSEKTSSGFFTAMTEKARSVVCDTGPIIHLDELGCLDLLSDFEKILLALSVVEEIEKHSPAALTAKLPFQVLRVQYPAEELSVLHHARFTDFLDLGPDKLTPLEMGHIDAKKILDGLGKQKNSFLPSDK